MTEKKARALPSDKKEREYIVKNTGECLLVEAGAGTGKTTLLIDRVMSLILKEGVRLSDIAAITFTEKAAGELKVRLYEKLEERLERGASAADEVRLRQAISDMETCQVSTIHSFASSLLRTRPVEAGVDPNFAVADENEMRLITEEAWRDWLAEGLAGAGPLMGLAPEFGVGPDNLRMLAGFLYENRDLIKDDTLEPPGNGEIERLLDAGEAILRETAGALEAILKRMPAAVGEPSMDQIQKLLTSWQKFLRTSSKADLAAALVSAVREKIRKTRTANWPGTRDDFNEQLGLRLRLKEEAEEIVPAIGTALAPGVLLLALDYIKMVVAEKEKRGVLDFQDLLIKTRDMLRDNREVRRYYQERFSHVLVDEFQDTDPLQAEIVFFLAEDGALADEWDSAELKPGKLFIVGDPKQSIYRFRRADVEIYDRAKAVMGGEERTRYITQNFRSVADIVEWVNDTFSIAMQPQVEGVYQAEYREILPAVGGAAGAAVRLLHNREHEKETADIAREREAALLAGSIREMVSTGFKVRDRDGRERPVKHSDICVLLRIMTNVHIYERAFRERDIPFRTEGGRNFFNRQEVLDISNAVRAIDNPYDQVSLIGALRSPLFAVSDTELAGFALTGKRFDYLPATGGGGTIADAFRVLAGLHGGRHEKPISSTLEELLDRTKAREVYAALGMGEQTLANFSKLIDEARALESREGITLSGFARWLSDMERSGFAAGESPTEEVGEDFVHVMSIHKAKGLEFPVVFIAGIGKGPGPRNVELLTRHKTGQIEFKIGLVATRGYADLDRWSRESDRAEECRVFYVSTTRARDLLVIHDLESRGSSSWFKRILDETGARSVSEELEESVDLCSEDIDYPPRAEEYEAKEGPEYDFEEEERAWQDGLLKSFEHGNSGPVTSTATGAEGTPPPPRNAFWPGVEIGKPAGTALHRIMEMVRPSAGPGERESLVRSISGAMGVADRQEQLLHMVNNVTASGLWERAVRSSFSSREVPFRIRGENGYMSGTVDLVFLEDGEAIVVDYKADNVAADETGSRLEFYREQGEFYRNALGLVLGRPVKDVVFFFAAPGVALSLTSSR